MLTGEYELALSHSTTAAIAAAKAERASRKRNRLRMLFSRLFKLPAGDVTTTTESHDKGVDVAGVAPGCATVCGAGAAAVGSTPVSCAVVPAPIER